MAEREKKAFKFNIIDAFITVAIAAALALFVMIMASSFGVNASTYNYFVGPAPGSREDYLHGGVYADDVTVDGQMTFYAEADVEHSLTAYVTRLEVPNG